MRVQKLQQWWYVRRWWFYGYLFFEEEKKVFLFFLWEKGALKTLDNFYSQYAYDDPS